MSKKLYVGNLPYSIDDEQLQQHFAKHGAVRSAQVIVDRATNQSKGFGFVEMETDAEAQVAIDMLHAAAAFTAQNDVHTNSQLFITGYSQGGHAAMALHREIDRNWSDEFTVTASAPLSGPYSISGVMRNLILTDKIYYYRGGMLDWDALGLTSVKDEF